MVGFDESDDNQGNDDLTVLCQNSFTLLFITRKGGLAIGNDDILVDLPIFADLQMKLIYLFSGGDVVEVFLLAELEGVLLAAEFEMLDYVVELLVFFKKVGLILHLFLAASLLNQLIQFVQHYLRLIMVLF